MIIVLTILLMLSMAFAAMCTEKQKKLYNFLLIICAVIIFALIFCGFVRIWNNAFALYDVSSLN